jgi:hypothetical protein
MDKSQHKIANLERTNSMHKDDKKDLRRQLRTSEKLLQAAQAKIQEHEIDQQQQQDRLTPLGSAAATDSLW